MASDDALVTSALITAQAQYGAETTSATTAAGAQKEVAHIEAAAQQAIATIDAQSKLAVVQAQTAGEIQVAQVQTQGQIQVAQAEAQGRNMVAQTEAAGQSTVAQIRAAGDESVAATQAGATVTAAGYQRDATVQAATIDASWHANVATIQAKATTDAATIDASWHANVATIQANAQVQTAQIDASWHQGVANTEATASNYRADQELAGVNAHEAHEDGRLATKLAFAEGKFDTVWPTVQNFIGQVGGSGFFQAEGPGGPMGFRSYTGVYAADPGDTSHRMGFCSSRELGDRPPPGMSMVSGDTKVQGIGFSTAGNTLADAVAATQLPFISTSGVLTPAQVQQKLNQLRARADTKTQTESRKIVSDLTGRGFSASSPIVAALQSSLAAQGLRSSIEGATDLLLKSAEANADAVFKGQTAVADQWNKEEQANIDVQKNVTSRVVGVLTAVTNMVGNIV